MRFQEKLFALRKNSGLTQADLAEKINVSRQTVSRWELGTAKPEVDTLIAISDLFGVSLDDLLRDRPLEEREKQEGSAQMPPQYWDFVPKFWWIPAVFAVLLKILPYAHGMLQLVWPEVGFGISRWMNDHPVTWIFTSPYADFSASFFGAAAVLCFLWALYRFLKTRK